MRYERAAEDAGNTPAILQRLMRGDFSDLTWKNIGSALRISYLSTGDPDHEFALYHIRAGGRIPEHTHRGGEMTLILEGGFSDANGSYHAGDFIHRRPGDVHAPTALQSEDCICLAVLDAPLKFTDWALPLDEPLPAAAHQLRPDPGGVSRRRRRPRQP